MGTSQGSPNYNLSKARALRVVFMGTPDYALPVLQALLSSHHQVVGAYTQPDKPSGRGRKVMPPAVKKAALEAGLPVFQPESLKAPEVQSQLQMLRPEVMVVAAYGKQLPAAVLQIPPLGCLNVHPSLLPRHRGPSPVAWAILDGDAVTGVTIMLMDEGLDTGPILAQEELPINPEDTTESLTRRLFCKGAQLLLAVLPRWVEGKIVPRPQSEAEATYSRRLTKKDGELDWSWPAERLWRKVRAFTPWPGAYTWWRGKQLNIVEAYPLKGAEASTPGTVSLLRDENIPLAVATAEGMLGIRRLQMEGKKVLTAREFLAGYPDFPGSRLPS